MLYACYDRDGPAFAPMRMMAGTARALFSNPLLPVSYTGFGRAVAAGADVLEQAVRPRGKPAWDIGAIWIDGERVRVDEEVAAARPFCRLLHFARRHDRRDPKVLIVAPLSGHHATLLRGTVEALLPDRDVYVTDWIDARAVPLAAGGFGLDDYIDYLIDFLRRLGPDVHVVAVCQPAPLVLAAVALLAAAEDPAQPLTMTLMGGPIDTRAAHTVATRLTAVRPLAWFEASAIMTVPAYYPGAFRRVYPGFLQLGAFLSLDPVRHLDAHARQFHHLVRGDGDPAEAHRRFYDDYLAVIDVTAEYFLESVEAVFHQHRLPRGSLRWRGHAVEPRAIRRTALMTVEGALDDISAPGQTHAAHRLCSGIPAERHGHLLQRGVGHFGIFNGRIWRERIRPSIAAFQLAHDRHR